jgi:imidazolonepropionase-like amidohydrolase
LLGAWQTYAKTNIVKQRVLARNLERSRSWLIRDVRLVIGDGAVIERGAVLIRNGKIDEFYTGAAPEAKTLRAQDVDGAGKTLLPGLIDVSVRLASPGGLALTADDFRDVDANIDRELTAYLFSGVTAVKSNGDPQEVVLRHRAALESGEKLGAELFAPMPNGIFYQPMLAAVKTADDVAHGKTDPIDDSLVQQAAPRPLLERARQTLASAKQDGADTGQFEKAKQNLIGAYKAGTALVTGSGSGSPLLFHGPAVHRELQLWVQAGVPPAVALQAATYNAARSLGSSERIGAIRKGYDATLLLVDGNPLQEISATERISSIFFKGEHINRGALFEK